MITYPGLPAPVVGEHLSREESRAHYAEGTQFLIGTIEMVGNTGTYLDTPFHRFDGGYDLATLDLATVADVPGVCLTVGDAAIGPSVLDGIDVAGRAVLFHTGWDRHWRTDAYGDTEHPHLSEAAVARLVEGGASLVGIDSVNIDDTRGGDRPAHSGLLGAGIPVVEHLTRLGLVTGQSFRFFAVPPKVIGFGTFPVRAFALI